MYRILQEEGIDLPRYAVLNRDPDKPDGQSSWCTSHHKGKHNRTHKRHVPHFSFHFSSVLLLQKKLSEKQPLSF